MKIIRWFGNNLSVFIIGIFIAFEIIINRFFPEDESIVLFCWIFPSRYLFYSIIGFIILYILFKLLKKNNKELNIVRSFLGAHHGEIFNINGLFLIIFVFVQLHIIGTEFHHNLDDPDNAHWFPILFYICIMLAPFFLIALFMKKKRKIESSERKVLVSAISDNSTEKFKIFMRNEFKRNEILSEQITLSLQNSKTWNWNTIRMTFDKYENINKWIVFVDKKCKTNIEGAFDKVDISNENTEYVIGYLKAFVSTFPGRLIDVEIILMDDVNNFKYLLKNVKPILEAKLKPYSSSRIIFNISPGSALVSSAVTLLAIKGQRGLCYTKPFEENDVDDKLVEFEVDLFDISDVWESIMINKESKEE